MSMNFSQREHIAGITKLDVQETPPEQQRLETMFIKNYVVIKETVQKSDILGILERFFQNGSVAERQFKEMFDYLVKERYAKGLDKFLKFVIQRDLILLFLQELDRLDAYHRLTFKMYEGRVAKSDIEGTKYVLSGKRVEEQQQTYISQRFNFKKLEEKLSTLQCDVQTISDSLLANYSLTLLDHNDVWYCARELAAGTLVKKIQHAPRLTVSQLESLLRSVKVDPGKTIIIIDT